MSCSEKRFKDESERRQPAVPDVYLPAMGPAELQQVLVDLLNAWCKRYLIDACSNLVIGLRMRDLSRPRLIRTAHMPLRQLVAERLDEHRSR